MKKEVKNKVWSLFGTLTDVRNSKGMIIITNDSGDERKMSAKYRDNGRIFDRAKELVGKSVMYRTSQDTKRWNAGTWFSDIKEEV